MVRCALFASLMAVCAWIGIPMPDIAFTMQTFGVFLALAVLGGKWGTVSILIYLAIGLVGMPVFAGYRGGPGVLLGVTGGYIWGFLASGLVYWALERLWRPLALGAGLLACYLCGSLWFGFYAGNAGFLAAVLKCVVPYLIPDIIKLTLAARLAVRIKNHSLV